MLPPAHLLCHTLICGATGSGKSKLLELMIRQFIQLLISFILIDPKPGAKTAMDTIAWLSDVIDRIGQDQKERLYILDDGFSLDPFDLPETLTGHSYRKALERRIDWLACSMVRLDGSVGFEEMPRKHRWTKNALWFLGLRRRNKPPLGFHRAFDVLNVGTGPWRRLKKSVERDLPGFVDRDWEWISRLSARDQAYFLDSTISGFRRVLSESTLPMLSNDYPSFPFDQVVRSGGCIVAPFGKYHSQEVAVFLSHFTKGRLLEAAERIQPKEPFVVAIEEAPMVLGPDLVAALLRARSCNMPLIILCQSLASLKQD
jgi:hypothetical protein